MFTGEDFIELVHKGPAWKFLDSVGIYILCAVKRIDCLPDVVGDQEVDCKQVRFLTNLTFVFLHHLPN